MQKHWFIQRKKPFHPHLGWSFVLITIGLLAVAAILVYQQTPPTASQTNPLVNGSGTRLANPNTPKAIPVTRPPAPSLVDPIPPVLADAAFQQAVVELSSPKQGTYHYTAQLGSFSAPTSASSSDTQSIFQKLFSGQISGSTLPSGTIGSPGTAIVSPTSTTTTTTTPSNSTRKATYAVVAGNNGITSIEEQHDTVGSPLIDLLFIYALIQPTTYHSTAFNVTCIADTCSALPHADLLSTIALIPDPAARTTDGAFSLPFTKGAMKKVNGFDCQSFSTKTGQEMCISSTLHAIVSFMDPTGRSLQLDGFTPTNTTPSPFPFAWITKSNSTSSNICTFSADGGPTTAALQVWSATSGTKTLTLKLYPANTIPGQYAQATPLQVSSSPAALVAEKWTPITIPLANVSPGHYSLRACDGSYCQTYPCTSQ